MAKKISSITDTDSDSDISSDGISEFDYNHFTNAPKPIEIDPNKVFIISANGSFKKKNNLPKKYQGKPSDIFQGHDKNLRKPTIDNTIVKSKTTKERDKGKLLDVLQMCYDISQKHVTDSDSRENVSQKMKLLDVIESFVQMPSQSMDIHQGIINSTGARKDKPYEVLKSSTETNAIINLDKVAQDKPKPSVQINNLIHTNPFKTLEYQKYSSRTSVQINNLIHTNPFKTLEYQKYSGRTSARENKSVAVLKSESSTILQVDKRVQDKMKSNDNILHVTHTNHVNNYYTRNIPTVNNTNNNVKPDDIISLSNNVTLPKQFLNNYTKYREESIPEINNPSNNVSSSYIVQGCDKLLTNNPVKQKEATNDKIDTRRSNKQQKGSLQDVLKMCYDISTKHATDDKIIGTVNMKSGHVLPKVKLLDVIKSFVEDDNTSVKK